MAAGSRRERHRRPIPRDSSDSAHPQHPPKPGAPFAPNADTKTPLCRNHALPGRSGAEQATPLRPDGHGNEGCRPINTIGFYPPAGTARTRLAAARQGTR